MTCMQSVNLDIHIKEQHWSLNIVNCEMFYLESNHTEYISAEYWTPGASLLRVSANYYWGMWLQTIAHPVNLHSSFISRVFLDVNDRNRTNNLAGLINESSSTLQWQQWSKPAAQSQAVSHPADSYHSCLRFTKNKQNFRRGSFCIWRRHWFCASGGESFFGKLLHLLAADRKQRSWHPNTVEGS